MKRRLESSFRFYDTRGLAMGLVDITMRYGHLAPIYVEVQGATGQPNTGKLYSSKLTDGSTVYTLVLAEVKEWRDEEQ